MVERMAALGAERRRLTARLVGGASMFASLIPAGSMQMGDRNVIAVREVLSQLAIPIVGEMVGGNAGRSVWFGVEEGTVTVRSSGQFEQAL
jgi:chemotaxis protein CheD